MALDLAHRLTQRNFHSFFLDLDPAQGIVAGQSWEQTLYRKLRACRAVVALCTDHYLPSHWCFAEIALARMEGKQIFALLLDPLSPEAQLPSILTEKQFIDLRSDPEVGYQRLWRGLEAMNLVGAPGEWDPQQPPYLGLNAYQEQHAPIFCGREAEIRSGMELLGRGAPSFLLVLGASGSGKSSLVRAGMIPRLRRNPQQWLVVNPFRPGHNPFMELALALTQTYRRYAPEQHQYGNDPEQICELLRSPTTDSDRSGPLSSQALLARLLTQLETVHQHRLSSDRSPVTPGSPDESLWDFLDWSLDDLRRIVAEQPAVHPVPPLAPRPTPLLKVVDHLRQSTAYPQTRVLIVVDQLEELLGSDQPDDIRNQFLQLLMASVEAAPESLMVLATMRSDLLGGFQRNPILRGIDFESLSVGPISLEGMRRIIETPAQLGAITLESGLADRLLADTETSDALPLLSFTLWVMWRDYRGDGKLEVREYEELGGLFGAIAREADALLLAAQRSNREVELQRAFVRLVKLTADGNYARRPLDWDAPELQPVQDLIERFVDRRLLVFRANGERRQIEVAHEALFRTWQPLKTWLNSHRAELLLKQQLTYSAMQWAEQQRSSEYLWRGGRLQQAQGLLQHQTLTETEQAFIHTAIRQRQRRRLTLLGITGGIMVSLLVSLGFALDQLRKAKLDQIQTYIAFSDVHLAFGHIADAQASSIQAGEALRHSPFEWIWPNPKLKRQVISQLQATAYRVLERHRQESYQDQIVRLALNPQSGHLASSDTQGTVWLWHDTSGSAQLRLPQGNPQTPIVWGLNFSPDGQTLATASSTGLVILWAPSTGTPLRQLQGPPATVPQAVFSPDGSQLATAGADHQIRIWSVASGQLLRQLTGHGHDVLSLKFNGTGQTLWASTTVGLVHRWALDENPTLTSYLGDLAPLHQAALDAEGKRLATIDRDRNVSLWDIAKGQRIQRLQSLSELGQPLEITAVDFSPDGYYLVTSDADGRVRFWLAASGLPVTQLSGRQSHITTVVFSQDGKRLATGSDDGKAIIWDTSQLERNPHQTLGSLLQLNCQQFQQALVVEPDAERRDRTLCHSILVSEDPIKPPDVQPTDANPQADIPRTP